MIYVGNSFYNDPNFIAHHGILGQKWGIRRFQNKDGTLTSAGRRRYDKLLKKEEKIKQKREKLESKKEKLLGEPETNKSIARKSVFDMTDDEINHEIARMDLEKKYREHLKEYQSAYSVKPKESKLRSAGREAFDSVIKPSLITVGKQVTERATGMTINKIGKSLGLKENLYSTKGDKEKDKNKEGSGGKSRYDYEIEKMKIEQAEKERKRAEKATKKAERTANQVLRRAQRDAERERRRNRREARSSSRS